VIAAAWTTWAFWWAVLAVATAFVALFCGLETGIYVLNKIRLDLRAEAGDRRARRLRRMLARPNNLLAVLLIGTNVSSYAATFAVTTMFVLAGSGDAAEWYALAVATPLLFILGESVPKDVFQRLTETLVYRLSGLLAAADVVFKVTGLSPLVRGISWLVMFPLRRRGSRGEERLRAIFAEGAAAGVLTHTQTAMVDRVMRIGDVPLAEVMVPIEQVAWIAPETRRDEMLEIVRRRSYSRLPVRNAAGEIVGVLDVYDVLAEPDVSRPAERMGPAFSLAASTPVPEALYHMQRAGEMMVVVRYGDRPVGIATIKDLVEEIVGELEEW